MPVSSTSLTFLLILIALLKIGIDGHIIVWNILTGEKLKLFDNAVRCENVCVLFDWGNLGSFSAIRNRAQICPIWLPFMKEKARQTDSRLFSLTAKVT